MSLRHEQHHHHNVNVFISLIKLPFSSTFHFHLSSFTSAQSQGDLYRICRSGKNVCVRRQDEEEEEEPQVFLRHSTVNIIYIHPDMHPLT